MSAATAQPGDVEASGRPRPKGEAGAAGRLGGAAHVAADLAFTQVDVFGAEPYLGNPLAVVLGAEGLSGAQMRKVARWTNLSETTFVLPPTQDGADYRVRIFTPAEELPFAGHPTLGTAHAWLEARGEALSEVPAGRTLVQECGAGLVRLRRTAEGLAFAAPPLVRWGPVEEALVARLAGALGLDAGAVQAAAWVDNGPGWVALQLASARAVLDVALPKSLDHKVGLVGLHPPGGPAAYEVRAFFPKDSQGTVAEDPVTGSLNASLAQWLLGARKVSAPYAASQGAALSRRGLVHIDLDSDGAVWVAGRTVSCVQGRITV